MDATHAPYDEFTLTREDEGGVAFLSCDRLPDLFIAATSDEEIRSAIDGCMKEALKDRGERVQVFTNGRLRGPSIGVVVKIT